MLIDKLRQIAVNQRFGLPYDISEIENDLRDVWEQYVEFGFLRYPQRFPKAIYIIYDNTYVSLLNGNGGGFDIRGIDENDITVNLVIPAYFISLSEGDRVQYAVDRV